MTSTSTWGFALQRRKDVNVFDVPIDLSHSGEAIGTDIVKARDEEWR